MRFALVAAAFAAALTAQNQLVVPAAAASVDGNSSSTWPFDVAAARLLYIYDSSHFTANGVNAPVLISQIRWRANATTATWTGSSGVVQLDLSTAPIDFQNISATWNANHGLNRATVYSGPLAIPAGSSTAGVPGPFHVTITFNTPFLYDPAVGDLVIDTIHSGLTPANTPAMDMVTTAGTALARRISSIANPPAATGAIWTGEAANVVEFTYTPAAGLSAAFSASATGGATPLAVTFTDQSFSSAPGGITGWAWDFDGDNVVDSTLPNPTHVYTACGSYTVSLTVTDGVNPPNTRTRTNLITTDLITANFSTQVIAAQTVQFTDTSSMPATSWAWDLDGDNVTDSTAQNPVWAYANLNPVNVSLTVTRLCSPPSTTTRVVVPAQSLTTNLAANNGGSSLWTIYFDADVLNPFGIEVSSFDSITTTLSTAFTVDVYLKQGSYVGSEFVPAAWTQVGVASGTSNAVANQPSNAVLAQPLYLPQGQYGVALRYTGISPRYITGTGTFGNGDLSLTLGAVGVTTAGPFATGTLNTPRTWSGTLYYDSHNINGSAGYGFFGDGCAGTLGKTSMPASSQPTLGGTLTVGLDNLPFGIAVMVLGTSNTAGPLGPLPLDLGILGAPGCPLRVSVDVTDTVVGVGNAATWSFAVPNSGALSGFKLYNQAAVLDTSNAFGFVTSKAYAWIVGS
ncbi:MAG: PKD domain-containing protein [Phycisphaerales bacterium]|nr:PKD domain-containing protein [Phycisphaerales bacterium]